ncbi:hypothetical protein PEDI_46020 [Persicobacter diffluens]|uniref:Uncharacterized protein n=1 Tax=Persicobacter diffluens TaxID=981 RepID=A0AAN4W3U9_9BACT|nr:hypothetical protein PEDI_46020 [Persicobacter diffluens]
MLLIEIRSDIPSQLNVVALPMVRVSRSNNQIFVTNFGFYSLLGLTMNVGGLEEGFRKSLYPFEFFIMVGPKCS